MHSFISNHCFWPWWFQPICRFQMQNGRTCWRASTSGVTWTPGAGGPETTRTLCTLSTSGRASASPVTEPWETRGTTGTKPREKRQTNTHEFKSEHRANKQRSLTQNYTSAPGELEKIHFLCGRNVSAAHEKQSSGGIYLLLRLCRLMFKSITGLLHKRRAYHCTQTELLQPAGTNKHINRRTALHISS